MTSLFAELLLGLAMATGVMPDRFEIGQAVTDEVMFLCSAELWHTTCSRLLQDCKVCHGP